MNTVHTHWSRTGGMEHSPLQKQAERQNQLHDSDKNVHLENSGCSRCEKSKVLLARHINVKFSLHGHVTVKEIIKKTLNKKHHHRTRDDHDIYVPIILQNFIKLLSQIYIIKDF